MQNNIYQIAIDGPAASGKSTIAKYVADRLHIKYFSTGLIFRLYTYLFLKKFPGKQFNDQIANSIVTYHGLEIDFDHFYVDGQNIVSQLTSDVISQNISLLSQDPIIRQGYEDLIKKIIAQRSVVLDGRDIATKILPHTPYKFFLTASLEARAQRRYHQLLSEKKTANLEEIIKSIAKRDTYDTQRKIAPLKQDKDAYLIDSSDLSIQEVVDIIIKKIGVNKNV